jgi:hypothetical protein
LLQVETVNLAKMDCEGGEAEALLAASGETHRRIKHVSLERRYPGDLSYDEQFFGRRRGQAFAVPVAAASEDSLSSGVSNDRIGDIR